MHFTVQTNIYFQKQTFYEKNSKFRKDTHSLREKCPYSEFFWSVFFRIWTEYGEATEYLSVFGPNAGKYRPEKLRIRTLFTQ